MKRLLLILTLILPSIAAVTVESRIFESAGRRWVMITATRRDDSGKVLGVSTQVAPLPADTPVDIPPPQMADAPAVRAPRPDLTPILADIDSRMPAGHPYTASDPWTWGHETSHGIHARLRNAHMRENSGQWNALYVPGGKVIFAKEPPTTIGRVAPLIPRSLRGMRYNLYLVQQRRDWDDRPLYLLDEFMSYINGARVFLETSESRRANWIVTPGAVEFAIYATCVAWAAGSDDDQLRRTLALQWQQALKIYEQEPRPESREVLSRLQQSPDAADLREFCSRYFGEEWTQANLLKPLPAPLQVEPGGRHWMPPLRAPEFYDELPADEGRDPRVLVFLAAHNPDNLAPTQSDVVRSDVLPWLESAGWTVGESPDNHLQLMDGTDWRVCQEWQVKQLPTFIRIEDGREQQRYAGYKRSGVTAIVQGRQAGDVAGSRVTGPHTPFGASDLPRAGYPVRGGWWTFPGSTRGQIIQHLMQGEHAGKFHFDWLNTLSWEQLRSLHSDDHEGRVKWQYVPKRALSPVSPLAGPQASVWRAPQHCPT